MLAELRKDYFTDRLAIVSTERTKRPFKPKPSRKLTDTRSCAFCPGKESMTPLADLVLVQKEGALVKLSEEESGQRSDWCVRVFPHRQPLVTPDSPVTYSDSPLFSEPAQGYHYVVVATPDHKETFAKISVDQWVNVLSTVQDRVRWMYGQKGVSYVVVYINHGREAGASSSHPHLQLLTLPKPPPLVEQEAETYQRSMHEYGSCPMCTVVSVESGGPRQILSTNSFTAFSPWASTHAYEFWIFPKQHQTSFLKTTQHEMRDLALMLRSTLGGLWRVVKNPPFSLVFHTSSEKKTTRQIHWHMEVYPHLAVWAGLEHGTGVYANEVVPERAAEVLGAMSRKELAELIGIT